MTQGVFLEWFLSYRHFLVGTWTESEKPTTLSRDNILNFTEQDASGWGWKVKWGSLVSWTQSCHCHITTLYHITHLNIIPQIPLGVCSAHLCISSCWTSTAKPLQSAGASASGVRPIFLCCDPTSHGAEQGWQLILSAAVLLRVAESDPPFAARLYLFFIWLCFLKKKKKKIAGKIVISASTEDFLESWFSA